MAGQGDSRQSLPRRLYWDIKAYLLEAFFEGVRQTGSTHRPA
jgi:hypothetical protein